MKIFTITLLLILCVNVNNLFAQHIEGTWQGNLEVQPGKSMLFIFEISKSKEDLIAKLAIPSQGLTELQPASTTFIENKLSIDASNLGFKFNGKWDVESGKINGTFQEGLNSVPLILTKEELIKRVETPKRPQEPAKPYPYLVEEVKIYNSEDDISLAGTLTLPRAFNRNTPVVVLISGSGPQDRDESYMGHKPFLVLSDYLTRQGIAVLRYDDRGVGESTGNFEKATTADFSKDVLSVLAFLKSRTDIGGHKIGLIGHSEGAIIAPKVANSSKDVSFIIMLAGTGVLGKQVSLQQALDYRNFPVEDEKRYKAYIEKAIAIAASDKETTIVKEELRSFYQNSEVLTSILPPTINKAEFIDNLVKSRTGPWIRYFYHYNPAEEITKIDIPALALYGSNDTQVPPKYNMKPVKEALQKSKSGNYEVVLMPDLNHLFQESTTGQISEYPKIEQTMSPKVLEKISRWILKEI
ncbi:alpha/beta hydrolase family protein [Pontibacter mangrovi]|uniref:Alpha/beta hydrolase n=1 Tax=Pontibacter mangrovi TaxID=2589816 RepID=A0A501W5F0_9BACT|nr:alpha/beta hydrolase [Pontibacter mangrovi]TPE42481.1 alpha/beta hydrolase [Pontibacter mangrovi]